MSRRYAEGRYLECHYAECHHSESHYAECHWANIPLKKHDTSSPKFGKLWSQLSLATLTQKIFDHLPISKLIKFQNVSTSVSQI